MSPYILLVVSVLVLGTHLGSTKGQAVSQQAPECFNTTCPCCNEPCQPDGRCNGNCKDGYHGGKCWNKCPGNCVTCVDAPVGGRVATCTVCKDGYYSTTTQYQCQQSCSSTCKTCDSSPTHCTSCRDGDFLTPSSTCVTCNEGCLTCTSGTLCTSCKVGYYKIGDNCQRCGPLCSSCSSNGTCICSNGCSTPLCDETTGVCTFGCKPNFITGGKCDSCISGNFGYECNENCTNTCDSKCDKISGICEACKPEYFGDYCNSSCPVNCKSMCNQTTGHCDECEDGYYGNTCKIECIEPNCKVCTMIDGRCTICIDGYYGDACVKICPENCLLGKCIKDTGNCECKPGYTGAKCEIEVTTTPTNTTKSGLVLAGSADVPVGAIVGGTLGGVVIVFVVMGIIFMYRRRRTSKYKGPITDIDLDAYKFDSRLTDVLEDDEDFDPTYFTAPIKDLKKPLGRMSIKELIKFVDTHDEEFYQDEFLKLPRGLIKPFEDAKKEENIIKNRYNGVYPYDEHRVKLLPPGDDFINACYIDGFKKKKEYIASLGPTMKAMEHFQCFWRMVWQEKTDVIVMVTNLMEGQNMKCEQYWPSDGKSARYGDIKVMSQKEETYSEFVVKVMKVSKDGEDRELHHIHYTAWPDKRVPGDITSLIEFRQKVKSFKPDPAGPIIVHCSAGIGRTGTYIALDILIQQGKKQKSLDIFEWITNMRQQRTSMVQTWQQYQYLHHVLVHALSLHCEPIKSKKFQQFVDTNGKRMTGLFKQLQKAEKLQDEENEAREMNKGFDDMNRGGADIPGNLHRPNLHLEKLFGECNYINAVYLNSYTKVDRYLTAQTPLPDTVMDFLTLIIQENCTCIVSLDAPGLKDPTIGAYYSPVSGEVFTSPSYQFDVESQQLDSNSSYVLRKLTIRHNVKSGTTTNTVYHFQCQHWPQGNRVPNVSLFLQLVQDVEAMVNRDQGRVLVHCMDAATRSCLFCAVSNLIRKMTVEGEVSVVNTLRQIKVRRLKAIPHQEQYEFCYQSVLQMLKGEETHDGENALYTNV